jgi:hypothetical protein
MEKLRFFDAYAKPVEEFRVRTTSGAVISIVCAAFMVWMFLSELAWYLTTEVRPEISIDTARAEKLQISFDVTFPKIPCAFLGVDSMDVSGEHQLDLEHGVYKKRLDASGRPVENAQPKRENVDLTR